MYLSVSNPKLHRPAGFASSFNNSNSNPNSNFNNYNSNSNSNYNNNSNNNSNSNYNNNLDNNSKQNKPEHIHQIYKFDDDGVNITKLNYPSNFGTGLWFSIHVTAKNSVTLEDKRYFIIWIDNIVKSIRCNECKTHAMEYVNTHPVEPYFDLVDEETGLNIGIFKWSWVFHNAVNSRIGKPYCSWETAMSLFFNELNESESEFKPCDEDCGSANSHQNPTDVSTKINNQKEVIYPLYFRVMGKQF